MSTRHEALETSGHAVKPADESRLERSEHIYPSPLAAVEVRLARLEVETLGASGALVLPPTGTGGLKARIDSMERKHAQEISTLRAQLKTAAETVDRMRQNLDEQTRLLTQLTALVKAQGSRGLGHD